MATQLETQTKKREWFTLLSEHPSGFTAHTFVKYAKSPRSAFHDDFTWNPQHQQKEYLLKRAASLIRRYTTQFNTRSAEQRLYAVSPMPDRKISGKIYKNARQIKKNRSDVDRVISSIYSRLRTAVRDMEPFVGEHKGIKEIYAFLKNKVMFLE